MGNKEKNIFEKGMEYESNRHNSFSHKFFGWGWLIMSIIWLFSIWSLKVRVLGCLFLLAIGGSSLYLGYSEAKEARKIAGELNV